MPAYDAGFKMAARVSGRQMATIAGRPVDEWVPIVSEVQTAERFADRAFRARRGSERFVVYLEAYTYWKKEAPWNLLAKSALLSERERLPTHCLVFILRPRRYRPQRGRFQLHIDGKVSQFLRFNEIRLWEVRPQSWWEEVPGLMALYPLCKHGRTAQQAVAHAANSIAATTPDTIVRADLLTTLALFGRLVYKQLDVVGLIGREQMKESPLYEEIGDEARAEAHQADVLEVLKERFGAQAAASSREGIKHVTKPERLRRLHRLALRSANVEEFQRGLRRR